MAYGKAPFQRIAGGTTTTLELEKLAHTAVSLRGSTSFYEATMTLYDSSYEIYDALRGSCTFSTRLYEGCAIAHSVRAHKVNKGMTSKILLTYCFLWDGTSYVLPYCF